MDSVKDHAGVENLPENKKLIYPADKDYTDTELAIKYLHTEGYRDIVIIGGGEGRVDHLLAIISLFSRRIKPSEWYTYRERAVFVESEAKIECETGQIVSVYPCSDICIASTDGLKWELNDYYMDRTVFSVSNSAVSAGFTIKLKTGTALVIINY